MTTVKVNPLFPALRSGPMAVSGASRHMQIPSSETTGATWQDTAEALNRGNHATAMHAHAKVCAMLEMERRAGRREVAEVIGQICERAEIRPPEGCDSGLVSPPTDSHGASVPTEEHGHRHPSDRQNED